MLTFRGVKHAFYYVHHPLNKYKMHVTGFSVILSCNYIINRKVTTPIYQLNSQLSSTSVRFKAPTGKGWKTIAVTGHKLKAKENLDDIPSACEEGKEAVLHSDLIAELQKCNSISAQIEQFCSLVSLSNEEIERRSLFCQSLEEILKMYFTNFKLHQFGSSVNGLGFKGCDLDLSLQTLFNNEDYVTLKDVPTISSVNDGAVSQETLSRLTPMFMLRFVRRILREHSKDIKEPILFIKARCPIIRFYNAKYDVFCDFSCESETSLRNTRLLRLICHLEEKFMILAKMIRYWGKYGGFVGDIDMFNSYAFSLFVIHFLQRTDPPILPSVKEMMEKSNYLKSADVSDVAVMMEDLKNFQSSNNSTSLDQLLKEFFFYYLNFDFERVIIPFTSATIHKTDFIPGENPGEYFGFGTLSIQDPFRPTFNCTGLVSYKNCLKFISNLIQTCEVYQDKSNWIPGNEMWGLCSLFRPPTNDSKLARQWQQKRKHQIQLPIKPKAALKLKNILEHGLLFQCKEVKVFNDKDSLNIIIKLFCRVVGNTWQGRDAVPLKDLKSCSEPLEMEHLISKKILQSRMENKRELLSEFTVECRKMLTENEVSLIVDIEFKGEKYPYVLSIFLKEYIPFVFNKL